MSCSHLGMNLLAKWLKACGWGGGGEEERVAWGGVAGVVDDDDWSLLAEDNNDMLPVVGAGAFVVGLSVCARAMAGSGLRPWGGKHNRHQNE